jgi:hypothetical protein
VDIDNLNFPEDETINIAMDMSFGDPPSPYIDFIHPKNMFFHTEAPEDLLPKLNGQFSVVVYASTDYMVNDEFMAMVSERKELMFRTGLSPKKGEVAEMIRYLIKAAD